MSKDANAGDGDLETVTVNLIPAASRALREAHQLTEDTRTAVINRSIQVYLFIFKQVADGSELLFSRPDGTVERWTRQSITGDH